MADTNTNIVVKNERNEYIAHYQYSTDAGTNESQVVKVDKSTLVGVNGSEPATMSICEVTWNMQGFTRVDVIWNHTADVVALSLNGNGYKTFEPDCLKDGGSGSDGDVVFTTVGAIANASYDILIKFRKE